MDEKKAGNCWEFMFMLPAKKMGPVTLAFALDIKICIKYGARHVNQNCIFFFLSNKKVYM